jgi:hypothetical protein
MTPWAGSATSDPPGTGWCAPSSVAAVVVFEGDLRLFFDLPPWWLPPPSCVFKHTPAGAIAGALRSQAGGGRVPLRCFRFRSLHTIWPALRWRPRWICTARHEHEHDPQAFEEALLGLLQSMGISREEAQQIVLSSVMSAFVRKLEEKDFHPIGHPPS